jgi:hypothetical protein
MLWPRLPSDKTPAILQTLGIGETAVADRNALGKIGLMFVAATLFVMMTGAVVVAGHLTGRANLDDDAAGFGTAVSLGESR